MTLEGFALLEGQRNGFTISTDRERLDHPIAS